MEITELNDTHIGKKVSCRIYSDVIKEGKIQKQGDKYYICQNTRHGSECNDKLGYFASWTVERGSSKDISSTQVSDLRLLDSTVSNYEIF